MFSDNISNDNKILVVTTCCSMVFQHSVLVICVKTLKREDIYGLEGDWTL